MSTSSDFSSSGSTQEPGTPQFLDFGGFGASLEVITTLKEALSIAEVMVRRKPKRGVRLWLSTGGCALTWIDGGVKIRRKLFRTSSTITSNPSKKCDTPGTP